MSNRPLDGIRVVDLADEKGELAGRILADFGADVVRVEPKQGARSRRLPPFHEDESLYFAYRNSNKRGLALDLEAADAAARIDELVGRADVYIESFTPSAGEENGLGAAAVAGRMPHVVALSVTDFGQTGPYRDWVATDATLESISGNQFKAGTGDKPPLLPPGSLAYDTAGIMGAFAVLTALLQRARTGHGQAIDLSVLEATAQITDWSFSNATHVRSKLQAPPEMRMGSGPMYRIYACKGGYVRLVILSPRQWRAMREWLGEPEYLQDPMYDSFLGRIQIADALGVMIGDLFATMTHEQVSFEAQKRGIVCTPVLRPSEVLANEHFQSRGTFAETEFAPGQKGPVMAGFFEIDGERQGIRGRAPALGEHGEAPPADWSEPRPAPGRPAPDPTRPLEGLRVLDFGIGGVGVEAGRLFAEYGADVIKIESRTYPDFIRVVMSTEMSASFASSSRSKRGFGVNLKDPKGLAWLHALVKQADVVIENNSTGAMEGMGVGYETLRPLNPRIVMASSQLLGSRGTWADWIGYGPSTQPIGGLVHLWNYANQDEPAGSTSIFPDHLAGRLLAISALATLFRRERTGEGGHAEVAQAEAVTGVIGDWLLQEGLAPGSVEARGNRHPAGAPWGTYRCAGDEQWVTITVRDDADWQKFRMALGNPDWAMRPELETHEGRAAAHDELDERIEAWTSMQSPFEVTGALQMFGVPAAPMYAPSNQLADAHYCARGYPRWVEQQDLGWISFEGPAFRATGMPDVRITQAPKLGEHTREIARDLLGLSEAEIDAAVEAGALEVAKD